MTNCKFVNMSHPLITTEHLQRKAIIRKAIIYVRQSTLEIAGSRALYESQVQFVRADGWPEHLIEVIYEDMGKAGVDVDNRTGW